MRINLILPTQRRHWFTLVSLLTTLIVADTWAQTPPSEAAPTATVDAKPEAQGSKEDAQSQKDTRTALELAEAFYSAESLDEIEQTVKIMRASWPTHPLRWEIDSLYHKLQLRDQEASELALKALESVTEAQPTTDEASYAPEFWPLVTRSLSRWPMSDRARNASRLNQLVHRYPDQRVRASIAWSARHISHFSGYEVGYEMSTGALGKLLPLSVIGTWDNDQGKGLDTVYPPEETVDLAQSYQGKLTKISWRSDYPVDQRGKVNLGELLSPDRWQVAYAASAFEVENAIDAEVRLSTTDPVKVWLNGELILSIARVDGWLFDGVTLPVHLRQGTNQLLIKSAQQQGAWMVTARLTSSQGEALAYRVVPADTKPTDVSQAKEEAKQQTPLSEVGIRQSYLARFRDTAPARQAFHALFLLEEMGLDVEQLSFAEEIVQKFPTSLWLRVSLVSALWNSGERGRAADLIADLYQRSQGGTRAPYFVALQTRFWKQQRLDVKARKAARELVEAQPELPAAHRLLAKLLSAKGWHQESCQAYYEAERLQAGDHTLQGAIANCEAQSGHHLRARARKKSVWSTVPKMTTSLDGRYREARIRRDTAMMIAIAEECLSAWPQRAKCYRHLARALWEAERTEEAFATLERWRKLNPLSASPLKIGGEWLVGLGQTETAVSIWEEASLLDPDDQDLSLRLSELKPTGSEPWLLDVPSDDAIRAAIKRREEIKHAEGANQAYLLDDEVTLLKADGSSETVVTQVIHAFNQEGRDDLTKVYVGRGRRTQLMAAYAISPDGTRVEASSIRKGVVRFRQLKIGSTVVVQYRSSEAPAAYLVGHVSKSWWFQNLDTQVVESRWVLWSPASTQLKELVNEVNAREPVAPLERTEEVHGELKRVMWRMVELPPIPAEPRMPPLFSQVASLQISTVPNWEEVFKWERELLRDAFRVSPEVEQVAQQLFKPDMSVQDRFYAIQNYVTRNIRYQQDYEHTIAGVKPHTAAQVLARQYGDCKDKAVLFITLAKTAGLKADFALVRTRDSGEVKVEIPSQQFNHAIVYVPAQEGLAEGRFFDPTVDALDVQSLRSDDQGTHSLVYNPRLDRHDWREIPFQSAEFDQSQDFVEINVSDQGDVSGKLTITSRGKIGQLLRQRARNPESFKQVMQYRVNQLLPGAQMLAHQASQVEDLYTPAEATINFSHDSWVKREGSQLRLPAPVDWSPKGLFQLEERRFPLVLGHKRQWTWVLSATLPDRFDLSHLPIDRKVGSECLSISRTSVWDEESRRLEMKWHYQSLCERLSPEDYLAHRPLAREMIQLLNEEVVLSPSPEVKEQSPSSSPKPKLP